MPRRLVTSRRNTFGDPVAMPSPPTTRRVPVFSLTLLMLLMLLLAAVPIFAQLPTGTILGVVKDPGGNVLVGAKVTVSNDTGLSRTFTTTAEGSYRFPELPVGKYMLQVNQPGFKTATQKDLSLTVGEEAVLNITLPVGDINEVIDVTSAVPLVDTTSSSLSSLVGETTIAELPLNGRNYVDLTLLQPGVTQHTQENAGQGVTGTMYSSDGAPIRSNVVMLDGTLTTNQVGLNASSVAGTTLGLDGVKEYNLITNLASAEYFSSMGAQTSIVSKGGGNKLHGDIFEYLRNSSLDARNYFDPSPDLPFMNGKRIPPFKRNQYGGAIGGPLQKDKTFFFANYEGLRQDRGNPLYVGVDNTLPAQCWASGSNAQSHSILMTANPCAMINVPFPPLAVFWGLAQNGVPAANGDVNPTMAALANLYPYPNVTNPQTGQLSQFVYPSVETTQEDFGQIRFDHNFSTADSAFARYTIDNTALDKPDSYPQFHDEQFSRSQFLTLAENHIFSSTLLNTIRLSYARTNLSTMTFGTNSSVSVAGETSLITTNGVPQITGLLIVPGLTTLGPGTVAPGYQIQNLLTFADDVFWTRGKHAIKTGFLLNHYDEPMYNNLIFGSVNVLPTVGPPVSVLPGSPYPGSYTFPGNLFLNGYAIGQSFEEQASSYTPQADTTRDYTYWTIGGYLQDDYRATQRLTLNLGVRYEVATVPWDKTGKNYGYSNLATGDLNCPGSSCVAQPGAVWQNPTLKNVSPRVGFAFDPFGTGKTAFSGGYGIYYDIANIGSKLGQQSLSVPPLSQIENIFSNYAPGMAGGGFPFWPFLIPHQVDSPPCSPTSPQGSFGPTPAATSATCLIPQLTGNEYRPSTTYMAQYNFSVQQQMPGRMALTLAYAGSRGIHLRRVVEGNPVIPCNMPNSSTAAADPGGCAGLSTIAWNNGLNPVWDPARYPSNSPPGNSFRLNPNLPALVLNSSDGDSWYDALQASLVKQVSKGLQFQAAFTWSKLLDTTQGDIGSDDEGANFPSDPFNSRFDKGPTAFDAKINFRFSTVYSLPSLHSAGFLAGVTKGWTWSNILSAQSGYPFECMVQYGSNPSNTEMGIEDIGGDLSNDRCDIVTPAEIADGSALQLNPNAVAYNANTVITHNPNQWFNPNMFTLPHPESFAGYESNSPSGYLGSSGRGLMRGPGQFDWDMSLVKNTHLSWLGDAGNLQFRADFFNLINHTNFAFPYSNNFNANYQAIVSAGTGLNGTDVSPTAGQITNTLINARQIQFALKFEF